MKTVPVGEWVKQSQWHGNPELGYDCWMRYFIVRSSRRKVPIYVWGPPDSLELHYTVSAGHDSDLSYTGCFYPQKLNWVETMQAIDERSKDGRLIY